MCSDRRATARGSAAVPPRPRTTHGGPSRDRPVPAASSRYAAAVSTAHASDSLAQRDAEPLIIAAIAEHVGAPLAPARVVFEDGVRVELDGASEDRKVLVEAYAHVGALRGGQPKKLATDAFKLLWAGRKLEATRLVIAVIDVEVEQYLMRPKAWLTAALRDSGVEVVRVAIDDEAHARVEAAQQLQLMAPPGASAQGE